MNPYKSYIFKQLNIKESNLRPVDIDPETIDPTELKIGIGVEGEHTGDIETAKKIALHHLDEDPNYYSKMKNCGLKEHSPFSQLLSPTAKAPRALAISVRGTPHGVLPTSLIPSETSDTAIAPTGAGVDIKSKAALGGLELVSPQIPNTTLVDSTPKNSTLESPKPVADAVPKTPANEHPLQVQQTVGDISVQALTGTSPDGKAPMGNKPEPKKFDVGDEEGQSQGFDIDVPGEPEEDEEPEININPLPLEETKRTVDETFARHKWLMREKLGMEECKPCGCAKPNTAHPKKTRKLTENHLKRLKEHFIKKGVLNEGDLELFNKVNALLELKKKK
jgi:hypothetical protein